MKTAISAKDVNNLQITNNRISGRFDKAIDIERCSNVNIAGNEINLHEFNVKKYIKENNYELLRKAIEELGGKPEYYLQESYKNLKQGNIQGANNFFKRFLFYIKDHPELITGSVQILLQLFGIKVPLPHN